MYYVAIVCPAEINDKVLQFKKWMKEQFGCTVALRSPAHITLIPPFWMNEEKELELCRVVDLFKSDLETQEIELDGFSHFSNRVLFVNVKDSYYLNELRNQTEKHFIRSFSDVIKKDERAFHPHITIANRDMRPGDFEIAWKHFSNKDLIQSFAVRAISLLKLKSTEQKWQVIQTKEW
ncbi:MAG: 2'-5' RNA ligase family protein [Chitinophagaceae bacterium]